MTLVVGFSVMHRRYVAHSDGYYGDGLVSSAYCLRLFGDVATELAIRTDGDESLLAGYSSVELLAPVRVGDVLETCAMLRRIGNRSRDLDFEARVVCRANPKRGPSAADVFTPGLVVARAVGTIVVPPTTLYT